jgi:hypothetical protein
LIIPDLTGPKVRTIVGEETMMASPSTDIVRSAWEALASRLTPAQRETQCPRSALIPVLLRRLPLLRQPHLPRQRSRPRGGLEIRKA